MKSVLTALILLCAGLLLACNDSASRLEPTVDSQLVYAAHFWVESDEIQILEDAIASYEAIHQASVLLEPDSRVARDFGSQVKAGLGPDLVIGMPYAQILPLARQGLLKDLSDYDIDLSSYLPEHLEALTYEGKLYGLPFMATTSILYYNRNQVDTPPTSLTELLEQAKNGQAVGIATNFNDAFWGIPAFGGTLFDEEGQLHLTPASYVAWFRWLRNAQRQTGIIIDSNPELLREKFVAGELAYLVASTRELKPLAAALGQETVGAAPLPRVEVRPEEDAVDQELAGFAGPLFNLQVIIFNQAADEDKVRAGLRLAEFLNNPTLQRKLVLEELGRAPTNLKVFVRPDLSETGNAIVRQSRTAVTIPLNDLERIDGLRDAADAIYLGLLEGDLSPEDAGEALVRLMIEGR